MADKVVVGLALSAIIGDLTSVRAIPLPDAARTVYRYLWWITPVSAAFWCFSAAAYSLVDAVTWLAVLACLVCLGGFLFPLRRIPDDSDEVSPRSETRDPNRRKRLGTIFVGCLLLALSVILGGA